MEDKKIKNKIITISGEPVTGKGTNVKAMKQKLIDKGYKEDNIHIITTGHEFRRYFEVIIEFIKNLDNDDKIRELSDKKEVKEVFSNSEYRTKFIEEISKLKKLNKDFGETLTIEQANNIEELKGIREIVDTLIDENVKKMGTEINSVERPNEIWIVDSRLAFANIPESFAVRLTCRPEIAGKRLFEDNSRGKEDSKYNSIEDATAQREKRRLGEIKRYKERYGVDLSNEDNYNLIIDTSFSTIEDISDTILECLERYQKNEYIPKKWTSPKVFIPTQSGRQTWFGLKGGNNSLEEISENIKKNGYDPEESIDALEVDGILYANDGHHRCVGAARAGKTLIPYEVIAKDDEIVRGNYTARDFVKSVKLSDVYDHEDMYGKGFRYSQIYPEIYNIIQEKDER